MSDAPDDAGVNQWGSPRLAPVHCYGNHDPVELHGTVVCGACGAKANKAETGQYLEADDELKELFADER